MKQLIVAALSLSVFAATSAPAFADTYAIVTNGLKVPINLGGTPILPGSAAWTPLNATIAMPNGTFAQIRDMNVRAKDGCGWLISSFATIPSNTFVKLAPLEVGCILAFVTNNNTEAAPIYEIKMTQMPGGRCADKWWQGDGKDTIKQAVEWYHTSQKNALDAINMIAK